MVPGDARPAWEHEEQARQILADAEQDLREWTPHLEPIHTQAASVDHRLMPGGGSVAGESTLPQAPSANEPHGIDEPGTETGATQGERSHPAPADAGAGHEPQSETAATT
jgi:hypothetical protein